MNSIKEGDKVVCVPGYHSENPHAPKYGGAAYALGYEFIVNKITGSDRNTVLWEKGKLIGVFAYATKLIEQEPQYEIY